MVRRITAGYLLLLAVLLTACSRPTQPPAPQPGPTVPAPPVSDQVAQNPDPKPVRTLPAPRFYLYDGPAGFRLPETRRELPAGAAVPVGTGFIDLDVALPVVTAVAARQAVKVEGAPLRGEPQWEAGKGLALSLGAGEAGTTVTVTVQLAGAKPAVLALNRVARATFTVEFRVGDEWRPIAEFGGHVPPGHGEVRLLFSKPVRQQEVEQALTEAQPLPVRGLMQWLDDHTLIWQIAELPPRLDFLPGTARDADGLSVAGGAPSLRVGERPALVALDLAEGTEQVIAPVPPDLVSAELSRDGQYLNMAAWMPGTNRWDWQARDSYLDLTTGKPKPGRAEAVQPRLSGELGDWQVNPGGTLVAGFRSSGPRVEDLVIRDLRGGREQVIKEFVRQVGNPHGLVSLAWSADGLQVIALTGGSDDTGGIDAVVFDIPSLEQRVLASGLPLPGTGARLAWAPDGRYLQAGHILADLQNGSYQPLPGDAATARGAWEPGGTRLLYGSADWGPVFLVDPAGPDMLELGSGLLVGWGAPGQVYLVRWPASDTRYLPAGQ
jgi:hypothetical protein